MPANTERRYRHAALALLAVGVALRVWQTATRGSLWGDEAGLAMNVVGRDFSQIARPFIYMQVAPYLFVITEKVVTSLVGVSDFALRLFPLCAGIAALPLMAAVALRAYGTRAALLTLVLAVPATRLIHYTQELKPYSLDACVGALLLLLTLVAARDRRALHLLGVVGVIAPWFSLPSVFTLAGAGVALLADAVQRMRAQGADKRQELQRCVVLAGYGAAWLASFGVQFTQFLHVAASDEGMHEYYQAMDAFAPFPPRSFADLRWYVGRTFYTFAAPGSYPLRYLAGLLFGVGALRVLRDKGAVGVVFVMPWIAAFAASAGRRYVLEERTILFLLPSMYVLMALALDWLLGFEKRGLRVLALALLAALLVSPVRATASELRAHRQEPNLETVLRKLASEHRAGDTIFLDRDLAWRVDYYRARIGLEATFLSTGDDDRDRSSKLATLDGTPRLWVLLPSVSGILPDHAVSIPAIVKTERLLSQQLDGMGKRLARYDGGDCALYLYDLAR